MPGLALRAIALAGPTLAGWSGRAGGAQPVGISGSAAGRACKAGWPAPCERPAVGLRCGDAPCRQATRQIPRIRRSRDQEPARHGALVLRPAQAHGHRGPLGTPRREDGGREPAGAAADAEAGRRLLHHRAAQRARVRPAQRDRRAALAGRRRDGRLDGEGRDGHPGLGGGRTRPGTGERGRGDAAARLAAGARAHGQGRPGAAHAGGTRGAFGGRADGAVLGAARSPGSADRRGAPLRRSDRIGPGVCACRDDLRGPRRVAAGTRRGAADRPAEALTAGTQGQPTAPQRSRSALSAPSAVQSCWLLVLLVLVQLVELVLDALAQVAEAFLHLALDLVELALRLPVAVVGGDAADLLDLARDLVQLALEVLLVHGIASVPTLRPGPAECRRRGHACARNYPWARRVPACSCESS